MVFETLSGEMMTNSRGKQFKSLVKESAPLQVLGAVNAYAAMLAEKAGALDPTSPNYPRDLDDYERTLLRTIHGRDEGDRIFESTRGSTMPQAGAPVGSAQKRLRYNSATGELE